MKEKTKVWITIALIFTVSIIVIAFGNFIENQKSPNLNLITITEDKEIQINKNKTGKLKLEDQIKKQDGIQTIKLSKKELN